MGLTSDVGHSLWSYTLPSFVEGTGLATKVPVEVRDFNRDLSVPLQSHLHLPLVTPLNDFLKVYVPHKLCRVEVDRTKIRLNKPRLLPSPFCISSPIIQDPRLPRLPRLVPSLVPSISITRF